ncbi:rho-related BTB domain-containing protein 1-like [Haliotis rufescens]|uniref:rho-related BTB domain-containing protein 1-like n=1 Tax=Haliotis rufescens TaxID=6454 RepID=UPI001EB022FF|nr:rho-related BTB domain-containing protein 1-like [Haliotis rufescens]XP_048249283.1 rho-related BTB domain-containing protein 1-like [Haliotis rufescens]
MVNQQPGQNEVVKCVVVGDSGVGKTCMICAWACGTKYDLHQLVKTHVATVWAIDHYRHDREVLERSWCEVDGVRVSLRLWDTFGYHDKDRGFAYRGADVVILCFSVMRPNSLRNIKKYWYPDVRRFCPTTPIILAGTQADLRYMYKDENYINMEKGLLYRPIEEKDLITSEVGRDIAKDIGAPYYETSVLTHHGVEDVFINTVRAAMIERRKLKFWNAQLRRVQRPLIQPPMKVPKPLLPKIAVPPPTLLTDISQLLYNQNEGDAVFLVQDRCIRAHKICLMVSSPLFEELFTLEAPVIVPAEQKQTQLMRSEFSGEQNHNDEEKLLESDQESVSMDGDCLRRSVGYENAITTPDANNGNFQKLMSFTHPSIACAEVKLVDDPFHPSHSMVQTFVTMSREITPRAFQHILEYLYTGQAWEDYDVLNEVKRAAELMKLNDFLIIISNMLSGERFLNADIQRRFQEARCAKLRELALEKEVLTDIAFKVDNGIVAAHKPLLMARCEMMYAMFSSDFIESSAKVIPFPGITEDTFKALREYLYTGSQPDMTGVDCISLIEVANRLCLPRLVCLTENFIVQELQKAEKDEEDILEEVLLILEPAQLHNASQLAKWCLNFLVCHHNELHHKYHKMLRSLQKDNQEHIEKHRWPPIWYLKELEHYDKIMHNSSQYPEQQQEQDFNRWPRCTGGCLCFSRRGRARIDEATSIDMPF